MTLLIQLHCHPDDEPLELVMTHMIYRVQAGTSQSHLGDDPVKRHWQQGQGLSHPNPLGSMTAPRPAFDAPILEQLFHGPQGQSCPADEWELKCFVVKNVLVSGW